MPPKKDLLSGSSNSMIRIPPQKFIHVLDMNDNLRRLIEGPNIFVKKEHEAVILGPENMIILSQNHYVRIANPVIKDKDNQVIYNQYKEASLRFGKEEIRTSDQYPDPFPLYPGEEIVGQISEYVNVPTNNALVIRALYDFKDKDGIEIHAGDLYMFKGPATYVPKIEEEIVKKISAQIIKKNYALKLKAIRDTKDFNGTPRVAGETYIYNKPGAYLPLVDEEVIETVEAYILTDVIALHLRAKSDFHDTPYKQDRKAGDEWLVTKKMASLHMLDVNEELVGKVKSTNLSNRQYCVVLNPVGSDGVQRIGTKELRKGEKSFFLKPGESLENGIENIIVLSEDQAVLLQANEKLTDEIEEKGKKIIVIRIPGEKWMILGPREYIPPKEVSVLEIRRSIPLHENEGIYVRENDTGRVKMIHGQTYMLKTNESLWEKDLPTEVEELLDNQAAGTVYQPVTVSSKGERSYEKAKVSKARDKTKVVTFKAPHNSAIMLYDYMEKNTRIVFGPELVMLRPYEDIRVLTLSGDIPKKEGVLKNFALFLGPDFMADKIIVETSDHAKLYLMMSYNWYFEVDKKDLASCEKIFHMSDFVGDACKAVASRVRGIVSGVTFDNFHKHSSEIIQNAIFKKDEKGNKLDFIFKANNLHITNIDIQGVEPVDKKTKESLESSVTLSIKISSQSTEAVARHESERLEEMAKGEREIQAIKDKAESEKTRIKFLELQAKSSEVEMKGKSTAEAKALAEASVIEAEADVEQAKLQVKAIKIKEEADLELTKTKNIREIEYKTALSELEISEKQRLADIEAEKFKKTMDSLGKETIISMSKAGPETQAKLLKGLGLQGYMILDSKNPINLMNTANGFLGSAEQKK